MNIADLPLNFYSFDIVAFPPTTETCCVQRLSCKLLCIASSVANAPALPHPDKLTYAWGNGYRLKAKLWHYFPIAIWGSFTKFNCSLQNWSNFSNFKGEDARFSALSQFDTLEDWIHLKTDWMRHKSIGSSGMSRCDHSVYRCTWMNLKIIYRFFLSQNSSNLNRY